MSRVYISAAHKSSGKTTISIGLVAALKARGYRVQTFKKGPDYIDPHWLTEASGYACYNLDFNTMSLGEINSLWQRYSDPADITILEGNKGLYDGVDPEGSDCNAAMAKQLSLPVILVVDVEGITRGVAPLLHGYQTFDPHVNILGVILNKVVGQRHEDKLRAAVQRYTNFPVIGAIRRNPELTIDERHLGLVPGNEHAMAARQIKTIQTQIEQQVDLDQLISLLDIRKNAGESKACPTIKSTIRIGVAMDAAFGFYYADDLNVFAEHGAELVPMDMMLDTQLPDIDGLFIGGGFPETHMDELCQNKSLRHQLRVAIEAGLPVYAECGGLMYLCRSITWNDHSYEMVGALPADVVMHQRPQGRGYVRLKETGKGQWPVASEGCEIAAHEFHHSSLESVDASIEYAYEMKRGHGIDGTHDGIVYKNVLASYAHLRSMQASPWVEKFVEFVRTQKNMH